MPPVTLLQTSSRPEKPSCLLVSAHVWSVHAWQAQLAQQTRLGAWVPVAGRPQPSIHTHSRASTARQWDPRWRPSLREYRMCCREGRQQRRAALPDIYPSRHLPFQTWSLQRWSLQAWNLQGWNLQVQKIEERPGPTAARSARRAPPGARLGTKAGNTAKSGALAPRRWRWQQRWPGGPISCRSGWRALAPRISTSPALRPGR